MSDKSTSDLILEAKEMQRAQSQRRVTLETMRQRFKCSGGEVFNIIQGQVLEGELRDKVYDFLCVQPVAPPAAPAAPPKPPEVADLITPPSKRTMPQPRPPAGEPYKPPTPDPVPPVAIALRDESVFTEGQAKAMEAAPFPTPAPPADIDPLGKVPSPVFPVPTVGEKSRLDVGLRLRQAMKELGFTCETLAPFFGHRTGSNVSASLSNSGARRLQLRLCQFFRLDATGLVVPGWTEAGEIPKPGTATTHVIIGPSTSPGQVARAARHMAPRRTSAKLPAVPRATDAASPTLLSDEQTAAVVELALAANELNKTTTARNAAATRYKNALAEANAVGVRFATT